MLVFWDQRLVLLATPKTGSTAIAEALGPSATLSVQRPPELKHTTVQRYHRFVGPYLAAASGEHFRVVALMRDPESWLGSWYRYRRRDDVTDPSRSTGSVDFDGFVRAWCSDPQPEFARVGSQARFLQPRNGLGLDRLFRYENIDALTDYLEPLLGRGIEFSRLNVSPEAPTDLEPATKALLRRHASADYALYESTL